LAVGLVLAGAESEELVTAVFATARHLPGIAVGDAYLLAVQAAGLPRRITRHDIGVG
jgi:hypothetical protein